ncbi:MAG: alkylhydroperoxidase [Pseudomonadota bacterium]
MPWIETISYGAADGRLRSLYERIKGPDDRIDDIMMAHSLRPHTMEGHMALYKAVLHHRHNRLPKWFLETLGVWVSALNSCAYCVEHHFAGLSRLLSDPPRSAAIRAALESGALEDGPFETREILALRYAETLTRDSSGVGEAEIEGLRAAGYDDGEILEINQVAAYFAYANRTVLGLGCSIDNDILGLSPGGSGDPDDWTHS